MTGKHDMKTDRRSFLAGGAAVTAGTLAAASGFAPGAAQAQGQAVGPADAQQIVQDWPETARMAAEAMIEKYGTPHEATPSLLIWYDNGPWKRTIVYREEVDHVFPMPHKDVLEQVISYEVPPEKFDELAQYDGSVIVERTKGEISARCDKEAANFLAINLADKIVKDEMSVDEARQEYGEAIQAMMSGSPPEIMQGFAFEVPRDYAGDPGEQIIQAAGQTSGYPQNQQPE